MKKLYRKGTVHPSPQIKSDDHLLPLLPVAIFSLAAVLSPEDREVLAYLISTASYSGDRNPTSRLKKTKKTHFDNHSPLFNCDCFSCYTSYWVRWDESPSRQLIHEIIDAFEASLEEKKKTKKKKTTGKKDRRKQRSGKSLVLDSSCTDSSDIPSRLSESVASSSEFVDGTGGGCNCCLESTEELCPGEGGEDVVEEEEEKGSVRRFVSFIGERVFGVWG